MKLWFWDRVSMIAFAIWEYANSRCVKNSMPSEFEILSRSKDGYVYMRDGFWLDQ